MLSNEFKLYIKTLSKNFHDDKNIIKKNISYKINNHNNKDIIISNNFMSPIIREWIINNLNTCYEINIISNNNKLINLIIITDNKDNIINYIENVIECYILIHYIYKLKYKLVKIIYYTTPFKKTFDNDNILTEYNVNSGMTNGVEIYIWRIEEFTKVLIHELLHFYNLDLYPQLTIKFNNKYIYNDELYELKCELNTFVLYQILNNTDIDIDIKYSIELTNKLLSLKKIYKTKTNIFYYIIYKTLLLENNNFIIDNLIFNNNDKINKYNYTLDYKYKYIYKFINNESLKFNNY